MRSEWEFISALHIERVSQWEEDQTYGQLSFAIWAVLSITCLVLGHGKVAG